MRNRLSMSISTPSRSPWDSDRYTSGLWRLKARHRRRDQPAHKEMGPATNCMGRPRSPRHVLSDNSIGVPFERPPQFAGRTTLNDEEYAARERANAEQIAKDQSEFPETPFAQDSASNNAPGTGWTGLPSPLVHRHSSSNRLMDESRQ